MTALTSAAATWMPIPASVLAPAPLALGDSAEPCAAAAPWADSIGGLGLGGLSKDGRFGGRSWYPGGSRRQDDEQAQLAGGGPLRE